MRPQFPEIAANARVSGIRAWLHVAPIWVLEEFHDTAAALGPRRIIAVSSTSIATKEESPSARERRTVAALEAGELSARELAARCGAPLTIFRPAMIYGTAANRNVEVIRRWIRWFRFFPLVGTGRGRRQPVHAADVASACIAVLDRSATFGKLYQLAGAEVIEFKDMIGRVFEAESLSPRFVRLPAGVLKAALAGFGRIPGLRFLTPAMVDRVEQDLVFDIAPARADFGYAPRHFEPAPRQPS
ncbi:MAG: NAD-dependent epimerase/dehydratase family protein [Gammaproteobacteria bacterium]|nr:NAD-dependent epimerase/dehydratase family protein [Gammaproteobacteria bacterium]